MAKLKDGSTVGGKEIVSLDLMNEFIYQIQTNELAEKMKKAESDSITDFTTADTFIKDKDKNGLWQVNNATNNDGKYASGQLANFSNVNARFQFYAPNGESNKSALYFRTGWNDTVRPWERVTTKTMLDTGLNTKFDKTGGDISGNVYINGNLNTEYGIISSGTSNWFKTGLQFGPDRVCTLSQPATNTIRLGINSTYLDMNETTVKYKGSELWHKGNLNPMSRDSELLTASTDLDTITTTGYYRCNNSVNAPSKITGWAYIEVIKHSDTYVLQKIYSYDGKHVYSRTMNNGVWVAWRTLGGVYTFTKDITTGSWTQGTDMYEMSVTHNIGSENITSVIVTDSNKVSMFTGFQVISDTVIKVFCSTATAGKVVINAV